MVGNAVPAAVSRRLGIALAAVTALTSVALVITEPFALALGTTFTVNSVADHADADDGDGICDTGLGGGTAQCTLRAAIEEANANSGHDTIEFNVPGALNEVHTIQPATALPTIKAGGVTIDGYTQPYSAPNTSPTGSNADIRIELKGLGPNTFTGLYFQSSDNVVSGLAVFDFHNAIRFWAGSPSITADRNLIIGNHIGTNAAGTFAAAFKTTSGDGVHIQRGSADNRIGAPGNENRNVISGSSGRGVGVFNPASDSNIIENNIVGLNPAGTSPLQNWSHGVDLNWGASSNIVRNNVISGNGLAGVEISHDALASEPSHGGVGDTELNVVEFNLIGTDPTGLIADAVFGNGEYGVGLEGRGACAFTCPPDSNDNRVENNVIVGSDVNVKIWRGSHQNVVRNNFIGVLADGVTGSGAATEWGVLIEVGSIDNLIDNNRISQVDKGIVVRPNSQNAGDNEFPAFGNTFVGNSIEGANPGLGVDLAPEGVPTPSPDPALVQHGVGFGDITAVTTDGASVTACVDCVVELFETTADASAYGQGHSSLGTQVAVAGIATFVFRDDVSDPLAVDEGEFVSALVTDANGSTSEFSLRRTVAAGAIGPYVPPSTTTTTTSSTTTSTTSTTVPPTTTTTTVAPPTTTSTSTTTSPTTIPPTTTTLPPATSPSPSTTVPVDAAGPTDVGELASTGDEPSRAERCSISATC